MRSGVDNAFLYLLSVSLLDIFGRSEKKESIIEVHGIQNYIYIYP